MTPYLTIVSVYIHDSNLATLSKYNLYLDDIQVILQI